MPLPAAPLPSRLPASAASDGHEWACSPADFSRIQSLIHKRAGISLHDGKLSMVYGRVSRRLRATGHRSFKSYLDWLEQHEGAEWQAFINVLTTNLTGFFREQHHFTALADVLATRRTHAWRIWCCAASTGEEPYSIAMTASETLGPGSSFRLVCSDIDTEVLSTAQRAIYSIDAGKGLSAQRLQRFFMRGTGGNAGLMRVKPEMQKNMEFRTINLIEEPLFTEPFDLVFCRNVMIYFDAATKRQVLARIHRVLKPSGLLFVGHAESFGQARDLFVLRGKTIYERI